MVRSGLTVHSVRSGQMGLMDHSGLTVQTVRSVPMAHSDRSADSDRCYS
jgi:hypothetical protein